MSDAPVSQTRTFTILGHSGTGKTTLADAIAFKLGLGERLGLVAAGTSLSDTSDEEKARKTSIFAQAFAGIWKLAGKPYRLVFTDTPGAPGFYGQVRGAVRSADFALVTVDASGGVQVGTRRSWRICKAHNLSSIAFAVTGFDKENASFTKAIASIRGVFGNNCVPVTVPTASGAIINILDVTDLPPDLAEIRTYLAESAAETSEAMMNKYFNEGKLEPAEIRAGLLAGIAEGTVHPIYCVNALKDKGVGEMLDSICRLLPAPGSRPFLDTAGRVQKADPAAPLVAQVWKTAIDPFMGQLSYIRIHSGTLKPGAPLQNNNTGARETATALLMVIGRKQIPLTEAGPGDIVALPKLKDTHTGDTLAAPGCSTTIVPIDYPAPVTYVAIRAKTQADDDKLGTAIKRLEECDPTLKFEKQPETKEMLMKGLGDVHIEVSIALMKSQSNVSVEASTPKVPYRETVTARGEGHYRHKKQTGGHGQFGEVYLSVEPLQPGDKEWFADEVVGGAIPGNYIPAVEKGVAEGKLAGSVAGYPVQAVKVRVHDGSYHPVDSSEIAFKIAGRRAFREAMSKARPVLLEPIMQLKITIPEAFMGAISGDLPHKRGRVTGMESEEEGMQVISAEAPLAELFKYTAELRSLTGGQGTFTMAFARYEPVPAAVAQKIIAASARVAETDE